MSDTFDGNLHQPVLYQEIILALSPRQGGRYVDCTLGAGGHARGILEMSAPGGRLLGLEIDPQALEHARQRLALFGDRVVLSRSSYIDLLQRLNEIGWPSADGILLDLGASSIQLDTPQRGFSFLRDAPLDMRFDPGASTTAADLVNGLPEVELAGIIFRFGEERYANQIAHEIVLSRPITGTVELANSVVRAVMRKMSPAKRKAYARERIHPATRTFQALRIAVNHELESLESVLPMAVDALAPGGRLAVISFHSLEDRIVKQFMRRESQDCLCPPRQPICTCGHKASIREMSRRPVVPSAAEIHENPRSRSARLRTAEKIKL